MSRMSTLYTICTDENIYVRNRGRGMEVAMLMHIWAVITHLLKKKKKKSEKPAEEFCHLYYSTGRKTNSFGRVQW